MARPKPTKKDLEDRKIRATEWRTWMREHLFTEEKLSDVTGICRRTIQMIKAGLVTPHSNTIRIFDALKSKYAENAVEKRPKRRGRRAA